MLNPGFQQEIINLESGILVLVVDPYAKGRYYRRHWLRQKHGMQNIQAAGHTGI